MADELTPNGVRARRFDVALRGYERSQVEAYLGELADRIEALESDRDDERANAPALGISEAEALAYELDTIGSDIGEILEAARDAAEGIRSRASADANAWRADAESSSEAMIRQATEASEAMRSDAWSEGSAMLRTARAEADSIVAAAKEEALFVRAEAEREAIHLTGDARRDREESIRTARVEADQIVDAARFESEAVLSAARQQAELAQERARALEDRRSELLAELEATRASISEMESEIESKRQALDAPAPEPEPTDERTHHTSDSGSVRIVAATRVVPPTPVDVDELMAEVTALRAGISLDPPEAPTALAAVEDAPTPPPDATLDTVEHVEEDVVQAEPPAPSEPVTEASAAEAAIADESVVEEPTTVEAAAVEAVTQAPMAEAPAAEDDAESVRDAMPDDIGSLFAMLRTPPEPVTAPPVAVGNDVEPSSNGSAPAGPPPDGAESAAHTEVVPAPTPDPEPDESAVIPLQNAALREIKRALVDLQNETLEHLRTDAGWTPNPEFTDRFDEPFTKLAIGLGSSASSSEGATFATDLLEAVTAAIERTRSSGGGEREVAASASKVFRTWRSDEAERRVVEATDRAAAI
ncbi:MAG TPA: DivIVA domain-containing protein [Acidimicrobiia bacterium]|nr:DivIVA domain-containing protein [Acidimicrobiia bacterium]